TSRRHPFLHSLAFVPEGQDGMGCVGLLRSGACEGKRHYVSGARNVGSGIGRWNSKNYRVMAPFCSAGRDRRCIPGVTFPRSARTGSSPKWSISRWNLDFDSKVDDLGSSVSSIFPALALSGTSYWRLRL